MTTAVPLAFSESLVVREQQPRAYPLSVHAQVELRFAETPEETALAASGRSAAVVMDVSGKGDKDCTNAAAVPRAYAPITASVLRYCIHTAVVARVIVSNVSIVSSAVNICQHGQNMDHSQRSAGKTLER